MLHENDSWTTPGIERHSTENGCFRTHSVVGRQKTVVKILTFATRLPVLKIQRKFCRKTRLQKSKFRDRHLRQLADLLRRQHFISKMQERPLHTEPEKSGDGKASDQIGDKADCTLQVLFSEDQAHDVKDGFVREVEAVG